MPTASIPRSEPQTQLTEAAASVPPSMIQANSLSMINEVDTDLSNLLIGKLNLNNDEKDADKTSEYMRE